MNVKSYSLLICLCAFTVNVYSQCTYSSEIFSNPGFEQTSISGNQYTAAIGPYGLSSFSIAANALTGTVACGWPLNSAGGTDLNGMVIASDPGGTVIGVISSYSAVSCSGFCSCTQTITLTAPSTVSYTGNIRAYMAGFASSNITGSFTIDANNALNAGRYVVTNSLPYVPGAAVFNAFSRLQAHGGNFMAAIDAPVTAGSSLVDVWCQSVSVTAGTWYEFSAWYQNANTTTFGGEIPSLQLKINGTLLGSLGEVTAGAGWAQSKCLWQATANTTVSACVTIQTQGSGNGNDFYLDDLSFRAITGGCAPTSNCSFVLPVEFIYFKGNRQEDGNNYLYWATAKEENNVSFVIEKSTNGIDFKSIGEVDGKVNSNLTNAYNFIDGASTNTIYYYRIKQIDIDGKFSYSNVIFISHKIGNEGYLIYPNPIEGKLTISSLFSENRNSKIVVYDLTGKIIYEGIINTKEDYFIEFSDFPAGVYYLHIDTYFFKLLKTRYN